jgi:DNA-binding LacI/PurR family transcriptional regulator/DNA-binding transcriptional regulator YhcF (GntR family)
MASPHSVTPRVTDLAERLIADIDARGLGPGDRYLTTLEASKMLGVGNAAANRALQILERRRIIVRQQRKGAFVVEPPGTTKQILDRVHFLVHQKYLRTEGIGQDETLLGIEHALPAVPVQISFLPASNEAGYVRELIQDSQRAKRVEGLVLVRSSYETQALVLEAGVPAVVYGATYPSMEGLASLSADMRSVGRQLAEHLLSQGRRRLSYFNRQLVYHGDQLTMDGIAAAMHAAGCGLDRLTLRFLPASHDAYVAQARILLARKDRPTGVICRTAPMAEAVASTAAELGLAAPRDVEILVCDYYLKYGERPRFGWAKPQLGPEEQGRRLADLLIAQVEHRDDPPRHEVIPVGIEIPELSQERSS